MSHNNLNLHGLIINPKRNGENSTNENSKLKGCTLNKVDTTPYVGIHIDKYLLWNEHIDKTAAVLRRKVGMIYRLRHLIPQNVLLLLYNAFIQPHVSYGLEVWGCAHTSYLNKIFIIQKMAVRAITSSKFGAHSGPLFKKLSVLDVFKLQKF